MQPLRIVIYLVLLCQQPGLGNRSKMLDIQKRIPETAIEEFHACIRPGSSWLDERPPEAPARTPLLVRHWQCPQGH
jgi:hypothetical protein